MIAAADDPRLKAAILNMPFISGAQDAKAFPAGILDRAWRAREALARSELAGPLYVEVWPTSAENAHGAGPQPFLAGEIPYNFIMGGLERSNAAGTPWENKMTLQVVRPPCSCRATRLRFEDQGTYSVSCGCRGSAHRTTRNAPGCARSSRKERRVQGTAPPSSRHVLWRGIRGGRCRAATRFWAAFYSAPIPDPACHSMSSVDATVFGHSIAECLCPRTRAAAFEPHARAIATRVTDLNPHSVTPIRGGVQKAQRPPRVSVSMRLQIRDRYPDVSISRRSDLPAPTAERHYSEPDVRRRACMAMKWSFWTERASSSAAPISPNEVRTVQRPVSATWIGQPSAMASSWLR